MRAALLYQEQGFTTVSHGECVSWERSRGTDILNGEINKVNPVGQLSRGNESMTKSLMYLTQRTRVLVMLAMLATVTRPLCAHDSSSNGPDFVLTAEPFEFHSNFWINLHHFLYSQALPPARSHPVLPEMTASDKKSWDQANAFYRDHIVAQSNFAADDQLQRIDSYLARMENASSISGEGIGSDVAAVLTTAAPVYRRYWWPMHDAANRFWIRMTQPLIGTLGEQIRTQLAKAYETEWPTKPIRVDVSVYANSTGAYTNIENDGQIHTVLSSEDPLNRGFDALETLFHEASHGLVNGESGSVAQGIQSQAKAHNIPVPENLWHALIFYTAGEFVRQDLNRLGMHEFQPYADKQGVWDRGWQSYRGALCLFWQAHMDGQLSMDEAMSQIMGALAITQSK
jgi:hypothetical protein